MEIEPEKYDGKTSLHDYLIHFRQCWRRNEWTPEEAANSFSSSLRGNAVHVLNNISVYFTYWELEEELQRHFGDDEQSRIFALE